MIKIKFLPLALFISLPGLCFAADQLTVKAVNKLQIARASQTIELSGKDLAPLTQDLGRIHVKDAAGKALLVQAVDSDFDAYRKPDLVIFQADFTPGETKTFTITVGAKQVYTKEQFKAFGRFVRERFDDFTWENDRIAHRTYGRALETWEGEPLSSSTIDIWSKRTTRMVISDWYLADDYHADHGEGADFYSAGPSRGDGGSGLWADDRLWVSRNFVESRVLANGPIRVLFELVYEPFNVNGTSVSEVKRVSLDAGQQLDHYTSTYKPFTRPGQTVPLTAAIGLKKVAGEQKELNAERGWLAKWEKVEKNAGNQGLAMVMDPRTLAREAEDKLNLLLVTKPLENNSVNYWAGFCWDKAGHITTLDAWKKYVDEFAQSVASPIEVSVVAP
ncbi:MAG: DUF4861 family protein [Akkermansiaceae bacterium]|nr:DUF4861 family protein [Verrucomicrobiales bacterium]